MLAKGSCFHALGPNWWDQIYHQPAGHDLHLARITFMSPRPQPVLRFIWKFSIEHDDLAWVEAIASAAKANCRGSQRKNNNGNVNET